MPSLRLTCRLTIWSCGVSQTKIGWQTVVVAAEILDDRIERSVVVVELALQPAGIGQRVSLGDIRGLIVEEGKCFTCFCKNRMPYPAFVTYL